MTNSVFQNSRNLSIVWQQELVDNIECEMPDLVSAAALLILTFMKSPEVARIRLYSDTPRWTYTRCQEEIGGFRVVVGGFASSGLNVFTDDFDYPLRLGVGGLRKFQVIGS